MKFHIFTFLGSYLFLTYSIQYSVSQCNPGYYLPTAQSPCVGCSAGTYSTDGSATACTQCSAGYYSTQTAARICLPCGMGTYSTTQGSDSSLKCTSCEAGKYQQCNLIHFDGGNRVLRKVNMETGFTSTWIGNRLAPAGTSLDGFGLNAAFISPLSSKRGIASDGSFILMIDGYCIKRIDVHTGQVVTIVGSPTDSGSVMGTGTDARLMEPSDLLVSNNMKFAFIFDINSILYLDLSTLKVSLWLSVLEYYCYGCMDISPGDETLYIYFNNNVQKIDIMTKSSTVLAGVDYTCYVLLDPSNSYLVVFDHANYIMSTLNLTTLDFQARLNRASFPNTQLLRSMVFSPEGQKVFYITDINIFFIDMRDWSFNFLINKLSGGYKDGDASVALFSSNRGIILQCATGSSQCSSCAATMNSTAGSFKCFNNSCDPGYYAANPGSASLSCAACSPGKYSSGYGFTSCFQCNAGYFSTQSAASLCIPCMAGTYSTSAAASSPTTCTSCPSDTYQPCFLNVYDRFGRVIRRVDPDTGYTTTWIGNIKAPANLVYDGIGLNVSFSAIGCSTNGLSYDGSFILIGDNNVIRKVDTHTGSVSTVLGIAGNFGYVFGKGIRTLMPVLNDVVISRDSAFALIATSSQEIYFLNISTMTVSPWVGSSSTIVDGIGTNARISGFQTTYTNFDITSDDSRLYFSDMGHIRMVDIKTRNVTTIAGCGTTVNMVDGIGRAACLGSAIRLIVDPTQTYLLIIDAGFFVMRTMNLMTLQVTTVLGRKGVRNYTDGVGTQATLGFIRAMAFSYDGSKVFLASDTGIRVVYVNEWRITHLTRNDTTRGYMDGDSTVAMFNDIRGLNMQCATGQTQCMTCPSGKTSVEASVTCTESNVPTCAYTCPRGHYNINCTLNSPDACTACTNT